MSLFTWGVGSTHTPVMYCPAVQEGIAARAHECKCPLRTDERNKRSKSTLERKNDGVTGEQLRPLSLSGFKRHQLIPNTINGSLTFVVYFGAEMAPAVLNARQTGS